MPAKGYVNVATSLRVEDACILRQKLAELGFSSLHSFLKAFIKGENTVFTSKVTSKGVNEKAQNELISAKRDWAGRLAWLGHLPDTQKVGSSSLLRPTRVILGAFESRLTFSVRVSC